MNCAELDKRIKNRGESPSTEAIQHIHQCKRCMRKHSLRILLPLHAPTLQDDVAAAEAGTATEAAPVDPLRDSAPGELQFLAQLKSLSQEQSNPYHRAQLLHDKVQRGDRLFWRGEYSQAARHYREALMVVRDDQGRVALQNKLARAQMHRQRTREAMALLADGLTELGEPTPPTRFHSLHLLVEKCSFWLLILFTWCQQQWPKLFPDTVKYGDRSRAAQNLYRELSILSQGQDDQISAWAHQRELRWALLLKQPLELVVSWGRHAVQCAQGERYLLANWWCRKIEHVAIDSDDVIQASADFYLGRVAFIQGRMAEARTRLERCVKASQSGQDAYLKDAALQHLIRVYRNDGNFSEAVRVASQLLSLYHKLGNLPRLSACCRHFALIYASYGDIRQARGWAAKALTIATEDPIQSEERALSLLRCYVLQGDIELRRGRKDVARRFLGAAIELQRKHHLSPEFLRDGVALLRDILGEKAPRTRVSWGRRSSRWLAAQWAVMRGDLELAHHLKRSTRVRTGEHQVPQEMAYLFQEFDGAERPGGLRAAIPASEFALRFLSGEEHVRPTNNAAEREADQIASMFPVGAVSSRWGRGALARDRTGAITTQFSNASEAPWGYFFADDIG